MSTENTTSYNKPLPEPSGQRQYRTFEDLEVIQWLRERRQGASLELREDSPAYGLTDDQLDELCALATKMLGRGDDAVQLAYEGMHFDLGA